MWKYALFVGVSVLLTHAVKAQAFPAPGSGLFTWEEVGDRPASAESFYFSDIDKMFTIYFDSVRVLEAEDGELKNGHWRSLPYFLFGTLSSIIALNVEGDTLIVGQSGASWRSVNRGTTWSLVHGPFADNSQGGPDSPEGFYEIPPGHPHAGRLLAGGRIIYSDDRGATWTEANRNLSVDQGVAKVFASFPSGQVIMAGYWGMLRSEDSGTSYVSTPLYGAFQYLGYALTAAATPGSVQSGTPSCGLADLSLCDGAIALGVDATGPSVRAWWTNDGGRSWSAPSLLPEPFDGVRNGSAAGAVSVGVGPDGLGQAIAVLGRGVVYATDDGGQTWAAVGRLPIQEDYHSVVTVRLGPDGHLWVGTFSNTPLSLYSPWMYRSAEPAVAAFAVASAPPPAAQSGVRVVVRPNPSGGRVEIVVTVAEAQPVRVVVLDALGREVALVLDGPVTGERTEALDTSRLPAGAYVVRASSGRAIASTRLVVAR